jgi:hypothetical protein
MNSAASPIAAQACAFQAGSVVARVGGRKTLRSYSIAQSF